MSAREEILAAVRKNKPESSPLPVLSTFDRADLDTAKVYEEMIVKMGGTFKSLPSIDTLPDFIKALHADKLMVVSNVEAFKGTHPLSTISQPLELEKVDLAVLQGGIAVAENAAIWVSDEAIGFRALPFICQHLVLVFDRSNLVYNMHQAYQKLSVRDRTYGVFIAGPSKTADIEQSLVIGAHGPRSLITVMIDSKN